MTVDLQQFLAKAPRITLPSQYNTPILTDVNQELVFTFDLSKQGSSLQRGEVTRALIAIATPKFTFPAVPTTEIHLYHFLGVTNATSPSVVVWKTEITYPQFAFPQIEAFQINTNRIANLLSIGSGSSSQAERNGRPLRVFPEGTLRLAQSGDGAAGDVFTFSFLREVIGGAASVELKSNIVVATEQ